MTFETPTSAPFPNKQNSEKAISVPKTPNSTTPATYGSTNYHDSAGYAIPTAPLPYFDPDIPTLPGGGIERSIPLTAANMLNESDARILAAFRASKVLVCVSYLDATFVALSVLTLVTPWELTFLLLMPFALMGKVAASRYSVGASLVTYLIYCATMILLHTAFVIFCIIEGYFLDASVEFLKSVLQFWFVLLALQFRTAVMCLTPPEAGRLKSGGVIVARTASLIYV